MSEILPAAPRQARTKGHHMTAELRQFLIAAICAAACWLLMPFVVPNPTVAALVFVPLGLSTVTALLFGLNLAFCAAEALRHRSVRELAEALLRKITGRRRPDYAHIARLEQETTDG